MRIIIVDISCSLAKVEILWAQGFRSYTFKFHDDTYDLHLESYFKDMQK